MKQQSKSWGFRIGTLLNHSKYWGSRKATFQKPGKLIGCSSIEPSVFLKVVKNGTHRFLKIDFKGPGSLLGVPWDHFGLPLGSLGTDLGSLWDHLGSTLAYFGITWRPFGVHLRAFATLRGPFSFTAGILG